MKLIVNIPAYNEEKSIGEVIKSIPRKINGIKKVEVLVYDDGSRDKTVEEAHRAGADHVFSHVRNSGLAKTFVDAVERAVELGADVIVNTDADNQYDQKEIAQLVAPIVKKQADFVIGDRQVHKLPHMPAVKKYGNIFGSFIIRILTGTNVHDASSGFRAFTRECAQMLTIVSHHTYTHEMIIDAHFKGLVIDNVPVIFKKRTSGTSRLMAAGVTRHIARSIATIIRTVLLYKALAFFTAIGSVFGLVGFIGIIRYLYLALILGQSSGHVQSLILSSILIGVGFNILILGFVADLISYNRRLLQRRK